MIIDEIELEEVGKMKESPLYYVQQVFGLVPQPLKESYRERYRFGLLQTGKQWDEFCASVRPYWFADYREGLHLTWQQTLAFYGVQKALRGEVPPRISIVSGHGIGKSALLAMLILWFLWVHHQSQVACTSPSKEQMYDVLWKELKKWIERMPLAMQKMYLWESSHIRMSDSPQTWFARAKTSSKENTEALAGVHADWVLIAVDEASGVEEPIFETMEGALTSGNILVFLISNGTRNNGYFYDTHHKDAARWQHYSFNSEESPRVDRKYVDAIIDKYGEDSVQYAIRVKGQFPDEGVMDDKGYVALFTEQDLHLVPADHNWLPIGRSYGALDASGEGQDTSEWAVRDRMRAAIVASEKTSTSMSMAVRTLTVIDKYGVDPGDFAIDAFGQGHAVSQEVALSTARLPVPYRVNPINVGDQCDDDDDRELYINKRAMAFYRMMLWCRSGGEFMDSERLKDELLSIRFRRTATGRIQIMDKVSMKKLGYPSPDKADALSMTFLRNYAPRQSPFMQEQRDRERNSFDPFAPVE